MSLLSGATLAGVAACHAPRGSQTESARNAHPIGVNTRTVGRMFSNDPNMTVRTLAGMGFETIELGGPGFFAINHAKLRRTMDAEGVTAPSLHVDMDDVLRRPDRVVAVANQLGCKHIVLPPAARALRTPEGWRHLSALLNVFGMRAQVSGLTCAYLHSEEDLQPVVGDGLSHRTWLDILMEDTEPNYVSLELDLPTVLRANHNTEETAPDHVLARTRLIHLGALDENVTRDLHTKVSVNDVAPMLKRHLKGSLDGLFISRAPAARPLPSLARSLNAVKTLQV